MFSLDTLTENDLIVLSIIHATKRRLKGIPAHEIYDVFCRIKGETYLTTIENLIKKLYTSGIVDIKFRKREGFTILWAYKKLSDEDFEELLKTDERLRRIYSMVEKVIEAD